MNTVKLTYGLEDLISRLSSLFPYLEYDDNGECHLHKSTDSEHGAYGKLMPAIKMPSGIRLYARDEDGNFIFDEEGNYIFLIEGEKTYTYRTMMNYYYANKNIGDSFIKFVRIAIGEFSITKNDVVSFAQSTHQAEYIELANHFDEFVLVPETGYLSECAYLYDEYVRMNIVCKRYKEWKAISGEVNCELECFCDKFHAMGEMLMGEYYKSKYATAQSIADEYYGYANVDDATYSLNLNITSTENDLGMVTIYRLQYEPNVNYNVGDYVEYNGVTYKRVGEALCSIWNQTTEEYEFNPAAFVVMNETFNVIDIEGHTDSKLKSFRRDTVYVDSTGKFVKNTDDNDWLFYYKKGCVGYYETETDNVGNITIQEGQTRLSKEGEDEKHLMAYGNVLKDIEYNTTDKTLTFTYIIGAHLKAEYIGKDKDDDGNAIYFYGHFRYDDNDTYHGVIYKETYLYEEDSEIDELIRSEVTVGEQKIKMFDTYTKDSSLYTKEELVAMNTIDSKFGISYKYFKGEFNVDSKRLSNVAIVNGTPIGYTYIESEYHAKVGPDRDWTSNPTTKEDYFVGVHYQPNIQSDVAINRGNAASWERHIKLGEVKSFDDLQNYSNGGFFNIM